jgi:hypothetical protein
MENINIYGITRKKTKSKIDVLKDFINEFDTYNAKELSIALNTPVLKLISEIDSIQGLSWMTISQKVYRLLAKGYSKEEINLTLNIKLI